MAISIITIDDLQSFKEELLTELKNILATNNAHKKEWLKSKEVRAMLGISATSLQTLRVNGVLPYSKFGGTLYYKLADIENILEARKSTRYNLKTKHSGEHR